MLPRTLIASVSKRYSWEKDIHHWYVAMYVKQCYRYNRFKLAWYFKVNQYFEYLLNVKV